MSLFAQRREYQRSIERIFEDFSVDSQAQTRPSPEEVESNRHRSVISLGNQLKRYEQRKLHYDISRVSDGYEFIQNDIKAYGCFLDNKRKEQSW